MFRDKICSTINNAPNFAQSRACLGIKASYQCERTYPGNCHFGPHIYWRIPKVRLCISKHLMATEWFRNTRTKTHVWPLSQATEYVWQPKWCRAIEMGKDVQLSLYVRVYVYIYIYLFRCVCMYIYIHIQVCIYICIYFRCIYNIHICLCVLWTYTSLSWAVWTEAKNVMSLSSSQRVSESG